MTSNVGAGPSAGPAVAFSSGAVAGPFGLGEVPSLGTLHAPLLCPLGTFEARTEHLSEAADAKRSIKLTIIELARFYELGRNLSSYAALSRRELVLGMELAHSP